MRRRVPAAKTPKAHYAAARRGDADPRRALARQDARADGQTPRGPQVHAGQIRVSRRRGRAERPAHERRRPARRSRRGRSSSRRRAAPRPDYARGAGAGRDPRDFRGDGPRARRHRPRRARPPTSAWARFAATGVFPALDGIDFLARAITPPGRPRRFDARFFIADASLIAHRGRGHRSRRAELVELVWTPIEEALKLDIPHITRVVLGDLAALGVSRRRTASARGRSIGSCARPGCARN